MASRVGRKPLRKSKIRQAIPYGLPITRSTLVAPILPEPCSRILTPLALAINSPKGIEPARKAIIGGNQRGIVVCGNSRGEGAL